MYNNIKCRAGTSLAIFIWFVVTSLVCSAQVSLNKQIKNMQLTFTTSVGTIEGWEDDQVIRATGIPYAYSERFGYPKPFPIFKEVFQATKHGPAPVQMPSEMTNKVLGFDLLKGLDIAEQSQYLSVTIPKNITANDKVPVMIWVYGGSYTGGAGDAAAYDPKFLVSEQHVIVVNINYRLGILGFLGGIPGRPANLGLFDIIEALKWVKNNIYAFGGDPGNITVFGQSAGGDAVAHLMISDGVEGLFKRVIIQSAPLALRKGKQTMLAEMKEMSLELTAQTPLWEVLAFQSKLITKMKKYGKVGGMPFGVEYGQAPLPAEAEASKVWQDRAGHVDVLIGYAENELALLTPFNKTLTVLQHIPLIGKPFLSFLIAKSTRSIYTRPATELAELLATQEGASVYQYKLTWGHENGYGAVHIIDIPLLFGDQEVWSRSMLTKGISWSKVYDAGKKIRAVWGKFARDGILDERRELPGILEYHRVSK
ncbi:para-nitrobenzyl esterase [Pedobacter westerhofensis]|uniref:Carboxylic ester hydrolase n=1 Tax=Pedobacter westerhofensis TaxID=425512 RepID=A0A521FS97_9SPHI|nr:carboxylesterase family protein [Pedobacter westerhofensis]SMO98996.1 para-nitrobenzyl esterase [Pedobacter westerhofensis]